MKQFLLSAVAVAILLPIVQSVPLEDDVGVQSGPFDVQSSDIVEVPGEEVQGLPIFFVFDRLRDVSFRLFTKTSSNEILVVDDGGVSLSASNFNATNPTRFIIHGWNNDGNSEVNQVILAAYFSRTDSFNLITVDWSSVAVNPNYVEASVHVPLVGAVVADMILNLNAYAFVSPGSVTLIGHSLGAHVAGYAGRGLTGSLRVGNIVAMDPANPLFAPTPLTIDPVRKTDAWNVQSIQTSRGTLGQDLPIGHSSFYPNYGPVQPGCEYDILRTCAHGRSYLYYAESVATSDPFLARKCHNHLQIILNLCVTPSGSVSRNMGGDPLDAAASGIYYLKTNSAAPFSKGAGGIL